MIWIYIIVFSLFFTGGIAAFSNAPYLPTKNRDVARVLKLADLKKGDIFYDLGCGDGKLVFSATQAGARGVGIEMFLLPYWFAKVKSWFYPRAKIYLGNFYKKDLSDADVVFVFLTDRIYKKLIKKLNQDLKPGTKVIVSCWPIDQWKPIKVDNPAKKILPIYLYEIGKSNK